jgi:hypothetical protein
VLGYRRHIFNARRQLIVGQQIKYFFINQIVFSSLYRAYI